MKNKEENFNEVISELRKENTSLQEKLIKEESEKLDAIDCHRREKEARIAAETLQASFSKELEKAQQDILAANQRANSLDDMYNRLQEYNLSLQQYNSKLQCELETVCNSLKRVEKEKATIVKNLSTLRGHCNSLQDQLTSSRMVDLSAAETRTEFEEQGRTAEALQERRREAENQLIEGENLRKKLHNTILELKGNIRVFCRVRPLLPDDSVGTEASVISYPTSVETLGQKYSFTFDKVFGHSVSQQDVFIEISQLIQSALDCYKGCYCAAFCRSVGKTRMNEQSSGSHFVFTLRISGVNEVVISTEQQVQGVLNLIDLAGSERLSRNGATGNRLKETQAINKSLTCLSDVIFALAKEDHVPLRNSKLTYLLQVGFKNIDVCNISPEPTSVGESLCSLRFAARVNACEIGIPRRQTNVRHVDPRLSYG
ncbi:hypothetical protein GH714_001098 [Hevea brasiliensis]|uniref:Kinesin-like protein n=1 Tax=Hevea brasiliensis TaxID=3981 RepID=A0A6A6LZA1_HEVBR|nr:hypothetical protein GH714_001098 [Hevea brasiliensis]